MKKREIHPGDGLWLSSTYNRMVGNSLFDDNDDFYGSYLSRRKVKLRKVQSNPLIKKEVLFKLVWFSAFYRLFQALLPGSSPRLFSKACSIVDY